MNYGKKSVSKKRNSLISRSSMMGKRAHVSFIRVLFIGLIALCVAVSTLGIGSIRGILANTPDVNEVDIMPLGYALSSMTAMVIRSVNWQHLMPTDFRFPLTRFRRICSMQ